MALSKNREGRALYKRKGRSTSIENGCGVTTTRDLRYCWIKEATVEANAKNWDEQGTVQMNSLTLLRRDVASSGSIQGDAADVDEDDGALCGGGGA